MLAMNIGIFHWSVRGR